MVTLSHRARRIITVIASVVMICIMILYNTIDTYAMTCIVHTGTYHFFKVTFNPGAESTDVEYFERIDARYIQAYAITNSEKDRAVTGTAGDAKLNSAIFDGVLHYDSSRLMLGDVFAVNSWQNLTSVLARDDDTVPLEYHMAVCEFYNNDSYLFGFDGAWSDCNTKQTLNHRDHTTTSVVVFFKFAGDAHVGGDGDKRIAWGSDNRNTGGSVIGDFDEYQYKYVVFNPFTYTIKLRTGDAQLERWGINSHGHVVGTDDNGTKSISDWLKDYQEANPIKGWIITNRNGDSVLNTGVGNPIKAGNNVMLDNFIAGQKFYINAFQDLTFTAVYNAYNVTFDPNGGYFPVPHGNLYLANPQSFGQAKQGTANTITVEYGAGYFNNMSGDLPVRDAGYKFTGWYDGNGNKVYNADGTCFKGDNGMGTDYWSADGNWVYDKSENVTVYAHWEEIKANYTVNHRRQNADGSYTTYETDSANVLVGTQIPINIRDWSNDGYNSPSTPNPAPIVNADSNWNVINLDYPRKTYSLTVSAGTGISSVSVGSDSNALSTTATGIRWGDTCSVDAALYDGYTWAGWTGSYAPNNKGDTITMPQSDVSITATATPNIYTITFNANNGTLKNPGWNMYNSNPLRFGSYGSTQGTGNFVRVEYNAYYFNKMETDMPFRTGYDFAGWYDDSREGYGTAMYDKNAQAAIGKYWTNIGNDVTSIIWTNASDATVYAHWKAHTYTVTYKYNKPSRASSNVVNHLSNGGEYTQECAYDKQYSYPSSSAYADGSDGYTLDGWKFAGWNTKADGSGTWASGVWSPDGRTFTGSMFSNLTAADNGQITYYAIWQENTYTTGYDANTGSVNPNVNTGVTTTMRYEDTAFDLVNVGDLFNKTGYHINPSEAWRLGSVSGSVFPETYTTQLGSLRSLIKYGSVNSTAFANWIENQWNIHFNANTPTRGGETVQGSMDDMTNLLWTQNYNLSPNKFTLTGWTFKGWSRDATNYASLSPGSVAAVHYTDGQTVNNKNDASIPDAPNGTTLDLYAVWKENTYTVKFDSNKPSRATKSVQGSMSDMTGLLWTDDHKLSDNQYTLQGWVFVGWSLVKSDVCSTSPGSVAAIDYSNGQVINNGNDAKLSDADGAVITLYAVWREVKYTVVFNQDKPLRASSGVANVMASMTDLLWESSYKLYGNSFTLTGWTFLGWSRSPADYANIYPGSAAAVHYSNNEMICNALDNNLPDADGMIINLYAVWKENMYTIKFDGNDALPGTVTGSTPSMLSLLYEGSHNGRSPYTPIVYNLNLNGFMRTSPVNMEYRDEQWRHVDSLFMGWSLEPTSSLNYVYPDGGGVRKLVATNNGSITLYAVWNDAPSFIIGDGENDIVAEFPDRYFTLDDAHAGKITAEELLSTVSASDREGPCTITLVGFNPDDYRNVRTVSKIGQTYAVTDSTGRTSTITITVYIFENDSVKESGGTDVRGYDDDYHKDENGDYVDSADGGLSDTSKWRNDDSYKVILDDVVSDITDAKNSETETSDEVYTFDKEALDAIKKHVEEKGIGSNGNTTLSEVWRKYIESLKK